MIRDTVDRDGQSRELRADLGAPFFPSRYLIKCYIIAHFGRRSMSGSGGSGSMIQEKSSSWLREFEFMLPHFDRGS